MKFTEGFNKHPILYSYLFTFIATFLIFFSLISIEFHLTFSFLISSFLFYPCVLTVLNIIYLFPRHPKPQTVSAGKKLEILTIILGTVYSLLYFNFNINDIKWADWWEQLYNFQLHTPIAKGTLPTIIAISAVSIAAYFILRFVSLKKLPPLIIVLGISAMYLGIALCILWILQMFKSGLLSILPCLFPFNCILIAINTMKKVIIQWNAMNHNTEEPEKYADKPLPAKANRLMNHSANWPWLALLGAFPLLGICIIILALFGQAPDSIIKAWTETADWNLSQRIAPQNICIDEHYLCTVAAGGHKKVVKPLRLGERRGHEVIVNRQLCIANAFEQILEEKTPRFHRFVRHIYDTYGYPIAKHIHSPFAADAVYIIMKPAEWLFLTVIYLCDIKPENRIAVQYLPKMKTEKNIKDRYLQMIIINEYMQNLITGLKSAFGTRLVYVGLQGSYSRDEATQNSDIDIVVILDQLQMDDMDTYRQVINALECTDKSCGFICGKDEMASWNPLEICQLVHGTQDYYGVLQPLVPAYTRTDVMNYVKLGVCNLFHIICHEYIHASPEECRTNLQYSYKAVFYLLQNLHYLRTGNYIKTKSGAAGCFEWGRS